MGALAEAVVSGDKAAYDPFTGTAVGTVGEGWSPSARAGLEAPRYCQICGRRMVVRIHPIGWTARCSRHGELDSTLLER
ncbi:hypothetical protein C3B44_00300 [Corynebacterium yudongzhengii]|uniref:Biotin synthase auxiliary protein n=1 Tax=Corynebacterium yudongzhengii TaxID=2080740 RepID=A0A2U1T4H1_9CORY|nr:hypothetical protein [Corynebacterium yudongzhengii]AWB80981.1 hypothetical protein C3B44_00300 [Corynebacterium yudongzhengii]PWC00906.1 hypothetical protein DF222_10275 [Corynebacterium yudongzhengii]